MVFIQNVCILDSKFLIIDLSDSTAASNNNKIQNIVFFAWVCDKIDASTNELTC